MPRHDLSLSNSMNMDDKIELFFDAINEQAVVAVVVNPDFFEEIKQQACDGFSYEGQSLIVDTADAITFQGVRVFVKSMRDEFKIINTEEEFDLFVSEKH
ncbi:hypothetical protein Ctha_0963 [Chloroherpeton thalassium ATCC 35110]|uniref:Uncharacterized protein n=1 Tax=Chloroherpeton thalassium (strain ATCC 35110 / GB-78) TaxID=517418 RepID=B3QXF4_CHLT3|nr:hypothetical protein [Chloroherpeton thalassium]ACF13428.1 hypothetical protein Ctha_0963 [Chloroherpeton thalassium ATCC 35110]